MTHFRITSFLHLFSIFFVAKLGKKNVVYAYHGISFSLKKEGNSDACSWMTLENNMLSEIR